MTKAEAVRKLEELAQEIYETLEEMEEILEAVAPEEFERARVYWMAHIDGALLNRKGWMGGSLISLEDTLASLEEEDDEDWDSEDDEDRDDEDEDWDDEEDWED